jgi:ABC-type lipoprotein export system ATPase subunit
VYLALAQEFENIWKQVQSDMQQSGKTFADEETTEEEARAEYQKIAARRVRLGLVLAEIGEHANKLPSALSGGQQQRLAIARAMANDPPILIADEPTGSLDSGTAGAIIDIFQGLVQQGRTVLMVTHDKDIATRGSRLITLADGEIVGVAEAVAGGGDHA